MDKAIKEKIRMQLSKAVANTLGGLPAMYYCQLGFGDWEIDGKRIARTKISFYPAAASDRSPACTR
jgi:hypothetical protein